MLKKSKSYVLALVFALLLSACGGGNEKGENAQTEGENQNAEVAEFEAGREDGVYDINIASEPESIDPQLNTSVDGAIMVSHLFESLIRWDDDGEGNAVLKPGIAESWDVSEDGLKWTFHLRDAKWSDGKPITANDFVY